MKLRLTQILCMSCAIFLAMGCGSATLKSSDHPEVALSAWMADWDMERGWGEYLKNASHFQSICYFAADFDENDKLAVPENVKRVRARALEKEDTREAYLTIVNDVRRKNGKGKEKDLEVLKRVLKDEESTDAHIKEILALADEGKYDGIEIDYERVFKDRDLVPHYMSFTYRMAREAIRHGKKLRIVLEPSADFSAGFAKGPEYVVMLYNLYGTHSSPGPKADAEFIGKTIYKMNALPGTRSVAFATGGCIWQHTGILSLGRTGKKFLTEQEAVELRDRYQAKEERDAGSAALHFTYEDKGETYTVWYADAETLNAWITAASAQGIEAVSLWRLGGSTDINKVK